MTPESDHYAFGGEARPPARPPETERRDGPVDPVDWFKENVSKGPTATETAFGDLAIRLVTCLGYASPKFALIRAHLKGCGVAVGQWDQVVVAARKRQASASRPEGWRSRLVYKDTKDGCELLKNAANVTTILRNDPAWEGILARDEFLQDVVFRRPPPWGEDEFGSTVEPGSLFKDSDVTRIASWLARSEYELDVHPTVVEAAVAVVAEGGTHDSLRTYVESLEHDGVPRIETWLTRYLGVRDTPFSRFAGKAFLVSAIARALEPGAKVDHMLILEADQGPGKSTAFKHLFVNRFSESPIDLESKEKYIGIQGIWCQSFDELASMGRASAATANTYLTATFDYYRPVWAKRPIKVLRRNVFCGTVNPQNGIGYLKDATGGRRFWPVMTAEVGPIDLDALGLDSPQLWAEALVAYRAGVKWWPSSDSERAMCRAEQDERQQSSPLEEVISAWLEGEDKECRRCDGTGGGPDGCYSCKNTGVVAGVAPTEASVTLPEVMAFLQIPRERYAAKTPEVAAALHRIGWLAGRRCVRNKVKCTPYYRPGHDPDKPGVAVDAGVPCSEEELLAQAAEAERLREQAGVSGGRSP